MSRKKTPQRTKYDGAYKDEKRVVTYVEPEVKSTLAQYAIDQGKSLSDITKPKLKELADAINAGTI